MSTEAAATVYDSNVLHCERLRAEPDYYPAEAVRLGLTGNVSLAYSVDVSGNVQHVTVIHSAGRVLDDSAATVLKRCHFIVPANSTAIPGSSSRYRFGVTYNMAGKPVATPDKADTTQVVITATPIRKVNGTLRLPIAYSGGDGSSVEQAVIVHALSEMDSVELEFEWVGQRDPGCTVHSRHSFKADHKHFEKVDVKCPDGAPRTYMFDVSQIY